MSDLVKRTYRIHKDHDTKVKKTAKKRKHSESKVIRTLIEESSPTPQPK